MTINIRLYKNGDAEKICNLFSRHSCYQRDMAYWTWVNRLLSDENSIIAVAENLQKEIVGHYAIIPRYFEYEQHSIRAGLGIQAFIDPEYKHLISIFQISSIAYDEAKRLGLQFIYGFPNKNYRLVQEKIERWKKIAVFNAWEKNANVYSVKDKECQMNWIPIQSNEINDWVLISDLLENLVRNSLYKFRKSLGYIINRYLRHPQNIYKCYFLESAGNIAGFIVTKIYSEKEKSAHIIDLISTKALCMQMLLNDFETIQNTNVDKIVLWPGILGDDSILANAGYQQTAFDTFFGIKILDPSISDCPFLFSDISQWALVMGDSDAF